MDITKVLTISMAHITEETCEKLQAESEQNDMGLCVYDKAEYGYWIYIGSLDEKNLPEDLRMCMELAQKNDCQWLCLDCDGEEVPELPTYDW